MFERYNPGTCWKGGVLHWGEKLRLLHVPTNLYLDVEREPIDSAGGSTSSLMYHSRLSPEGCPIELEASRSERGENRQK
jgi:hypothetical protein